MKGKPRIKCDNCIGHGRVPLKRGEAYSTEERPVCIDCNGNGYLKTRK